MDPRPVTQPHEDDGIFLVTLGDNPFHLPVRTHLQAVRRYEKWDHHGCIPSIRDVKLEARVLDGPRTGEVIDLFLASFSEDGSPWGAAKWLVETSQGTGWT
jgi:hypothetical protein